jgi:RNA polymerase sigma factor (TIGR02999 family)
MSDITLLLESVARGESAASAELLPLVYDELRHLASARMAREAAGHTLQPTALVHEAWMRLAKPGDRRWNNRAHFFRAAAQAMRRILVDRARLKSSIKRGENAERLGLDDLALAATLPDDRVVLVDEALDRFEQQDPDAARIVTLKFFGGFTNREIAETLGVTERTVERQWAYARACLLQLMRDAG